MSIIINKLLAIAQDQYGYVAAHQIQDIRQAVNHQVKSGYVEQISRGIYRINNYPHHDLGELMVAYLWSKQTGVLSHETALYLHDLSNVLPDRIHITLPTTQKNSRRAVPELYRIYYNDVDSDWFDTLPITSIVQTLIDVACTGLDTDQLYMAVEQARERGYIDEHFEWTLIQKLQFRK